jgi:hypothetical protein
VVLWPFIAFPAFFNNGDGMSVFATGCAFNSRLTVIARDRAFNDPEAIFDLSPARELKIASSAYRQPRDDGGAETASRSRYE